MLKNFDGYHNRIAKDNSKGQKSFVIVEIAIKTEFRIRLMAIETIYR